MKWTNILLNDIRGNQIHEIYEYSFPDGERLSFTKILENVASGRDIFYTLEENGVVRSFALVRRLSDHKMIYLEYIATNKLFRNQGWGGKLLKEIIDDLSNDKFTAGILLEVESPDDKDIRLEEKLMRLSRIEFYKKRGGIIINDGGAYRMPNFSGSGSIAMRLMWIPFSPHYQNYPIKDLRKMLTQFYADSYERGENDPLLQSIIKSIP